MTRESRKTMVAGSSPEMIFSKSVGMSNSRMRLGSCKISRKYRVHYAALHNCNGSGAGCREQWKRE
jgi:hypothetical protein